MAIDRIEGTRFPYLPVEVRIRDQVLRVEALVDTGFDGDVVLPGSTRLEPVPEGYRSWVLADDSVVEAPVHYRSVQLGLLPAVRAVVALIGEEAIIGRGVLDRYRVIFDHGERVIVEP